MIRKSVPAFVSLRCQIDEKYTDKGESLANVKRNEPKGKNKKMSMQLEEKLRQRMNQNVMDMVSPTTTNRNSNKKRIKCKYNVTQQTI